MCVCPHAEERDTLVRAGVLHALWAASDQLVCAPKTMLYVAAAVRYLADVRRG